LTRSSRCKSATVVRMNDVQIDDLKQYISATVSQSAESVKSELRTEIRSEIRSVKTELRAEIQAAKTEILKETRAGFASIAESLTLAHDADAEHDRRLTRLEQQAV
jgi:hypothetical protein